ncbi:MAG: hypothetical protein NZ765_10995 [Anaerolineae bacterium]|nr:hypothetical protein [Anaerolineae bacterium]MDW8072043.1 hypothetical protein [Anaerolineae bacterium]
MAVEYPDIICEYTEAAQRYESDGVQIVPSLEPAEIPMDGYAMLILLLQNAIDVPTEVIVKLEPPVAGRLRGTPLLEIGEPELRVRLEPAQVGALYVPVRVVASAREGQYELQLHITVKAEGAARRIRPLQKTGGFRDELLDDLVGLDLGRVLGVGYTATPTRKIALPFAIARGAEAPRTPPTSASKFEVLWRLEDFALQSKAQREVAERRVHIVDALGLEPLYAGLLVEGHERCARAGIPLRIGEAVALSKILTFTVHHFLSNDAVADGLLVPIWEIALRLGLSTDDPRWMVRKIGFGHLVRLAVALSFGLVAKVLNTQPWGLEERRGLIQEIASRLDEGEPLPIELLYIPLLAASTVIAHQISAPGENVRQSLELLKVAKQARAEVFVDPELAQSSVLIDRLLETALAHGG